MIERGLSPDNRTNLRRLTPKLISIKHIKPNKRGSKYKLLSDADTQVKHILSNFLSSIEPEDKQQYEIDSKLKLLKESTRLKKTTTLISGKANKNNLSKRASASSSMNKFSISNPHHLSVPNITNIRKKDDISSMIPMFGSDSDNEFLKTIIQSKLGKGMLLYITLFIFVIFIHLLTCVFIFIGYVTYPNWIVVQKLEPTDYGNIYIAGLYFLCLTIFGIGYGDILSTNNIERVFNVFLLTVGLLLYTWLLSALSKIKDTMEIANLDNNHLEEYRAKREVLADFESTFPEMSEELSMKIQRHIRYKYESEVYNPKLSFDNLPLNLQKCLVFGMYKPVKNSIIRNNVPNKLLAK